MPEGHIAAFDTVKGIILRFGQDQETLAFVGTSFVHVNRKI